MGRGWTVASGKWARNMALLLTSYIIWKKKNCFHHEMGKIINTSEMGLCFALYCWLNTIFKELYIIVYALWRVYNYYSYFSTSEPGIFPLQWGSLWVESFTLYRKANLCKSVTDMIMWIDCQSGCKHLATFFLIIGRISLESITITLWSHKILIVNNEY